MLAFLKNKNISVKQAKMLFKFRTRMTTFSENFKGGKQIQSCPLCLNNTDMQKHSFLCKIIQENIHIKGRYEEIFSKIS